MADVAPFLLEELGRIRGEVQELERSITIYEDKSTFDPVDPRYLRRLADKRLLLEHLCSLRMSVAASMAYPQLPAPATQATAWSSPSRPAEPIIAPCLAPAAAVVSVIDSDSIVTGSKRHRADISQEQEQGQDQPIPTAQSSSSSGPPSIVSVPSNHSHSQEEEPLKEATNAHPTPARAEETIAPSTTSVAEDAAATSAVLAKLAESLDEEAESASKKRKLLPEPQLEQYTARKAEVGHIMRRFNDKKIVLIGVDNMDVLLPAYHVLKARIKQGAEISQLLRGSIEKYVTNIDKKKGEVTEKQIFVPEHREMPGAASS